MIVSTGYGGFTAAVNSRIAAFLVLLVCVLAVSGAQAQTAPIKLAVLGDSLAAGYGVKPGEAMPTRLEVALKAAGRNVAVINHGVSGDTTAGGV